MSNNSSPLTIPDGDNENDAATGDADSDDIQLMDSLSPTFNFATGDVIVRSTDQVLFRVHSVILLDATGGFKSLLAHQPDGESPTHKQYNIPERGAIIDLLLRFIYPMPNPNITRIPSLKHWQEYFSAARKYDVQSAIDGLRSMLTASSFLADDPLRVYAVAARFDLLAEADVAARHTFSIELMNTELFDELNTMSSFAFVRLIQLHRQRAKVVKEWGSTLKAPYGKCGECGKTHWTEAYVQIVRACCAEENVDIGALFKPSLILQAIQRRGLDMCEKCPVPGQPLIDEWFQRIIVDIDEKIAKMSVSSLPAKK